MVARIWTAVIPPPTVNEPLVYEEMKKVPADRSSPIIKSTNALPPSMYYRQQSPS